MAQSSKGYLKSSLRWTEGHFHSGESWDFGMRSSFPAGTGSQGQESAEENTKMRAMKWGGEGLDKEQKGVQRRLWRNSFRGTDRNLGLSLHENKKKKNPQESLERRPKSYRCWEKQHLIFQCPGQENQPGSLRQREASLQWSILDSMSKISSWMQTDAQGSSRAKELLPTTLGPWK